MNRRTLDSQSLLVPVREYLETPRCAVLSTIRVDGSPHQAVVHYALSTEDVLINGDSSRLWVRNLERDPRASLVIHDAANSLHWVGIRGEVDSTRRGREAVTDAKAMARRYGEDPTDYEGRERLSIVIRPLRVFEYGG